MTRLKAGLYRSVSSFALSAALLVTISCQNSQQPNPTAHAKSGTSAEALAGPLPEKAAETENSGQGEEDKTLLAVSKAIRKNNLTDRKDECLAYQFDPGTGKDFYLVEVRENHRYAKCGGDPNTSPRLFSVKMEKKSGRMSTDQGSTDGTFRALPD